MDSTVKTTTTDILTVENVGSVCIVTVLIPELNSTKAEELCTRLLSLLEGGRSTRFVLDFDQVRYMESACFGALVTFLKWLARYEGKIAIANVHENVRYLFAVTKLDRVFLLCQDVPAGLALVDR